MMLNRSFFVISLLIFNLYVTSAQNGKNGGKNGKNGNGATGALGNGNSNKGGNGGGKDGGDGKPADAGKSQTGPPQKDPRDPKYHNPNYIRDRLKQLKDKPAVLPNSWFTQFKKPFHPSWMDYCDPHHCNDYGKPACGLNRQSMKFKWFQSGCHIMIHNKCARYRGAMKYDTIAAKWCTMYVMYLRNGGCKTDCDLDEDDELDPVCAYSTLDNHVVLFKNRCAFKSANCRPETFNEYEEMHVKLCYSLI